jgi:hypothetical protein
MNKKTICRLALLCAVVLAVGTVGWAKTYHMSATNIVPGAAAELNVEKEKNGNVQVDVNVKHLAKPGLLTPPANSYVVWFQQQGSAPQNQGELKIGNDLKGELKSTTSLVNFNVFVTGETDPRAKTPSNQLVLQATVQQ